MSDNISLVVVRDAKVARRKGFSSIWYNLEYDPQVDKSEWKRDEDWWEHYGMQLKGKKFIFRGLTEAFS